MHQILHSLYISLIALFAFHATQYWILIIFCPRRKIDKSQKNDESLLDNSQLPKVTVQVPVYNERFMVSRIINAVSNLEYPSELLQIQILDDSTDDTPDIAKLEVDKFKAKGINIELIQRDHRSGFKAGALAEGLKSAHGEFIAIFDADFVPHKNFLRRLITERRGFDDPKVGFLQTRWVYLNRTFSKLTRVQAQMLDTHFFIDHPTRCQFDMPFNFNGSGGIWRRTCLEDAGGWHLDTLTEDLDLSYRAKMKGWRGIYYIEEESPNDLPTDVMAFKQQQKRWARGNAQCFRKLVLPIFTSKFSILQKISSIFHMVGYFISVFLLMFIIFFPIVALQSEILVNIPVWLHILGVFCLGYFLAIFIANIKHGGSIRQFFKDFIFTVLLMIGLSVNNTVAVLLGLFKKQTGVFERTPKKQIAAISSNESISSKLSDNLSGSSNVDVNNRDQSFDFLSGYKLKADWTVWLEITLTVYALIMGTIIILKGGWIYSVPMMIYACSFAYISFLQLREVILSRKLIDNSRLKANQLMSKNNVTSPAE
jgi:cellulose synthase/poly-beta-1,6-N-acetylglucosamine synthase-like glycosyltransferase